MQYLLVGVNASYSHTSLSVRTLSTYSSIPFLEFTINQTHTQILREIIEKKADVILFSTYIWNAQIICNLISDIKKILPQCLIGAGGPEFGYAPEKYFNINQSLDFIIEGEGEQTVQELKQIFDGNNYSKIKGIWYKADNKIIFSGKRDLMCDLSSLKFPYPELLKEREIFYSDEKSLENKILYYESSRGCPYSCSYCISSIEKQVRFMPLERVYSDLQIFLDAKIPLVKFVDRTYNINPQRYINIWKYIVQNHNGITMFHFEIEAEFLSEQALEFLQTVPKNVMQFEIGVQSSNKKTLEAINRSNNTEQLAQKIKQIPKTIHQHLDLIAGLPYEDLLSFGESFNYVMELKPDALQLGFLKVLPGTQMEKYAKQNGWKWMENPVYETFSTPYLSYEDMLFLKDMEILVDAFWNSKKFVHFMSYVGRVTDYWNFFDKLTKIGQKNGIFENARRETFWFEYVFQNLNACFSLEQMNVAKDLLRYDFVLRGKQGGYPDWYEHRYDKEKHRNLLEKNGGIKNARLDFAHSEYEVFDYDVEKDFPENYEGTFEKLIKY